LSNAPKPPCPTDETLAIFTAGDVDAQTRSTVLAHIEHCTDCMAAVLSANAHLHEEQSARRGWSDSRWWMSAVAAAAIIAVIIAVPLLRRGNDPIGRLVALAPKSERASEPRLSGGFAWAPYRGPLRSNYAAADSDRLKLGGAAGAAIERAQRDHSEDAQHAAAVALVLIDRPAEAIDRLQAIAQQSPGDARAWNDLAAARYAAAVQLQRPSLLPEALAATDRALRADARSAEALFNRALILESLGLTREARAAWERYLALDPSSPWANEARERLRRISAQTGQSLFQKELPRLERAAAAHDDVTVQSIVANSPQQCRTYAEAEHLGLWGEARQRGDDAESARLLTIARAVGDALVRSSGESLLREAVTAIDRSDPQRRDALARAHVGYRRGRMAYAKQRLDEGERELRDAAGQFAAANSPMAFPARYYAASALYDRHEASAACAEQSAILRELESRPGFAAMRAQVPWALALCRMVDGDWSGAAPLLARSEDGFRALNERTNLGFILTLEATAFTYMGRADEAWAARVRSFALMSAEGRSDRVTVSLGAAARHELREGRFDAALAMLQLEEAGDRSIASDALLVDVLVRQAVLHDAMGNDAAAAGKIREAETAAQSIRDPAFHARAIADVAFADGAVALHGDPMRARLLLTTAIDGYRAQQMPGLLPEPYLLRARASMQSGDLAAAMRDLDDGIAIVERHRIDVAGSVVGTGVLDAGTALFEEAIRLQLDRGDATAAFAYAERARARLTSNETADATALQRRLGGTGAVVVEFVALPKEVVAVRIDARAVSATRTPMAREQLDRLAAAGDLASLYDILIAPLSLTGTRQLIVVPDARLEGVPFGALYDSRAKQYLIERMPVSIAVSAMSLQRGEGRVPRSVLAIALPSGTAVNAAALAEPARELADVRERYPHSAALSGDEATFAAFLQAAPGADVVHIAGHTDREPGAGDAALLFADERVPWKRIAGTGAPLFDGATVVLAACETLRAPRDRPSRALTLGGGFLAAGASSVIGTLTPITDRDARNLFGAIHRALAAGAEPGEAVRAVQIAAIARGDGAWKSITTLTRRIPEH
jgi:CHAT domain-containing protein